MLLTIPFNPNLPGGYDKLTSAIQRYGKHNAHSLIVISSDQHEDEALAFAMKLRTYFGRYFAVTIPSYPESYLKTSNRMFIAAMDTLKEYIPTPEEQQEPTMVYHDPTYRPYQNRWLDQLQTDFYMEGAPVVFGNWDERDGDQARVVGPVAIHSRFLQHTKLLDFIPENTHWRDYLAWEMFNVGVKAEAFGKRPPAYIRPSD